MALWRRFWGGTSKDIAVDLGTANLRIFLEGKGLLIHEPAMVAVNERNSNIVAVGTAAKDMLGKTPPHIITTKPLVKGVISDFEVTERLLKFFLDKIYSENFSLIPRPRIVMTVPLEMTEVERKAVEDAAFAAGAREVYLLEGVIAAALGAGLPVRESTGNLIVNIGAGSTEIAVVSLGGVVNKRTLSLAGDDFTKQIIQYSRDVFNLVIGEKVAEDVKCQIGSTQDWQQPAEFEMRGRYTLTGLPRQVVVQDTQIRESLYKSVHLLVENIKAVIELTPAELVADIYENGLIMTGGGSLLHGLDRTIARETDIPVRVVDDPITVGIRGAGSLLGNVDLINELSLPQAGSRSR
ncbi:MAG: rod shape-determining protein [Patescibacteria group bacterium]